MAGDRAGQARVLIVDDDDTVRHLLELVLQDAGYETQAAASPAEALALTAESPVDLVVTDLFTHAAGRDPLQSAQQLKDQVSPRPVGVVTGWKVPSEEAEQRGFAFVVHKPFDLEQLLLAVAASVVEPSVPVPAARAQVVQRYFASLTARDWESMVDLCTDDVTYVLPAPAPFSSTIQGKSAFRAYTDETFRHFPAAEFTTLATYVTPRGVVARYQASWLGGGGERLRDQGTVVFSFEDDLIAQIGILLDPDNLREAIRHRQP